MSNVGNFCLSEAESNADCNAIEFRSETDDAWYTVLLSRKGERLIIKYVDFDENEDNVYDAESFKSVEKFEDFKSRFRCTCVQLQDKECSKVVEGMTVCASHSFTLDDIRFYDAIVNEVKYEQHTFRNGEEECHCSFKLFWEHGPNAGNVMDKGVENICILQHTNKIMPDLVSFEEIVMRKIRSIPPVHRDSFESVKNAKHGSSGAEVEVVKNSKHKTSTVELDSFKNTKHKSSAPEVESVKNTTKHRSSALEAKSVRNSKQGNSAVKVEPVGDTKQRSLVLGISSVKHGKQRTSLVNVESLTNAKHKSSVLEVEPLRNVKQASSAVEALPVKNAKQESSAVEVKSAPAHHVIKDTKRAMQSSSEVRRYPEDRGLGGISLGTRLDTNFRELNDPFVIVIDNLEKELSPLAIMKFISSQTSILSQACVFPSLSSDTHSRGAIKLNCEKDLKKLRDFLENPNHIITSLRGRPWYFMHNKTSAPIGPFISTSQDKLLCKNRDISNQLKIVSSGTKEYETAKKWIVLFEEFVSHQQRLHKKLALEEKTILTQS